MSVLSSSDVTESAPYGQGVAPLDGYREALPQVVRLAGIPSDGTDASAQFWYEALRLLPPRPQGLEGQGNESVRGGEGGVLTVFLE